MKRTLFAIVTLALVMSATAWGQPWTQDFGSGTGVFNTASGTSTTFLPNPGSGTTFVRIGTTGGSINLENPGLSSLGTNSEVRAVAPTSASVDKFTPVLNYTSGQTFYTKFKVLLGDASGGNTASSGTWYFFQGDGAMYSDANAFTAAQVFTGISWQFGASGTLTTNYRNASAWAVLGSTPMSQGNVYTIEIVGNDSSATINYTYNGTSMSVASYKQDIYIGGTLIGDDLSKSGIGNSVAINDMTFYGVSSTSNVANIFVDDIEYNNAIPASIGTVTAYSYVTDGDSTEPSTLTSLCDTDIEKILNFDFRVRDDSTGDDTNPTKISQIVIGQGTGNDVADWTKAIAGAKLFISNSATDSATGTVNATNLTFASINNSTSNDLGYVTDDGARQYKLKLWLKSDMTTEKAAIDGKNLAFAVDRTRFTTASGSTPFASGAGTAVESGSSNNAVAAVVTKLNFSAQPPASVGANADFSAEVEAADANGNRDLDATHSVSLARGVGAGTLSSVSGLTQSLASGLRSWPDLRYDAVESGVTIAASAAGLAPDTSTVITVTGEVGSVTAAGDSTEPASISALMDNQSESVLNFDFTVTDDGSIPGTDALPTLIDTVIILQGTGNDLGTWYNAIAGAMLLDNAGNSYSGVVGGTVIRFSHIPTGVGGLGYVADNATKHYRLKCWLKTDLTYLRDTIDGLNLAFRVNRSSFKALGAGSSAFAPGNGANVESGAASNAIAVTATRLDFSFQPTAPVYRATSFRADVEAVDSNGNRDRDGTDAVTLSRAAGAGTLSSVAGLTQNLASGLRSWTDLQYDVSETGVRIRATGGGFAADTCDAFAVIESEPTAQASGISFSAVGETQMTVNWTAGNGAGRIVLAKAGQLVSHPPVDGDGYTASSVFGSGSQVGTNNFVVYAGSGSSVTVTGLSPLTRYFFAVYEYNGSGATANYLTASPDTGSQMTNASLTTGDFQSRLDGNWSNLATWDQWNGTSWAAASTTPTAANTVYLSGGDTVTVDANGACKNLILYNATNGMRMSLNAACTLSVAGTLGSADNLPGAALIKGEGLVRFTGGSRALFGSTWSANPPGWRFEVTLDPGATGTTSSGIKAGQITVSGGTFAVGTSASNDLRPDSGSAGTGSVRVSAGATLAVLGDISRTSTATAPCALVEINGTLKLGGRNISATNININSGGKLVSTRTDVPRGHLITGTLAYASGSTLEYNSGTSDLGQATGGELTATVHNLTVNNAAGDTLKSNVTVNGNMRCQQGRLITGNYAVTLANDALLVESDAANIQGTVQLTRTLAQSAADTFNGLGLTITAAGAAPGATTVIRTTGRHYGVGGNQGINRSVSVSPAVNTGLNATMVMRYREAELNGLAENELGLFRSANNGASWDSMGGIVDAGANTLSLSGIGSFSLWTAGKQGIPLSVQLSQFTAAAAEGGVTLRWRTESECGTYQWIIDRSVDRVSGYVEIGRLPGQGPSCGPRDYSWFDRSAAPGNGYYYQLVEIDLDGTRQTFGPVHCLTGLTPGGALSLEPAGPNPFSGGTAIRLNLPAAGRVRVAVYNVAGQLVRELMNGTAGPGPLVRSWDGTGSNGSAAAPGVYVCRLETPGGTRQIKLVLAR